MSGFTHFCACYAVLLSYVLLRNKEKKDDDDDDVQVIAVIGGLARSRPTLSKFLSALP